MPRHKIVVRHVLWEILIEKPFPTITKRKYHTTFFLFILDTLQISLSFQLLFLYHNNWGIISKASLKRENWHIKKKSTFKQLFNYETEHLQFV